MNHVELPVSPGTNIFDLPVIGTSPSLSALLGETSAAPEQPQDQDDRIIDSRLGLASALFRALRLKHPPTAKHCLRVALGCSVFTQFLEIDDPTRERIEIAALLHDIGKIGVPDHVLHKPSRLDADEEELMDRNQAYAVHMLQACCVDQEVLDIVRYSGAWYDGTRPDNCERAGESLPLGARIIAIQNAFDAMTTDVVYRGAMTRERAVAEMFENAPSRFDPKLVKAFSQLNLDHNLAFQDEVIRRWVELSTGACGDAWSFAAPTLGTGNDVQAIFQSRLLESMHSGVLFIDIAARVVVWNRGAERLTGQSKESIQHQQWQPQILDMRDCEGNAIKPRNCPLLECLRNVSESTQRVTLRNRNDKSRTTVNVQVMPVKDLSGRCHGAILIMHDVSSETTLEARVQSLHTRATRDALTGVGNRAEFDRRHDELVSSHLETGAPLSLIICDIDRFKSINDTFGHQAGDAALISFAQLIEQNARDDDLVARYGGEEFILLCPNCDNDAAKQKAEAIRRELAAILQPALNNTRMTASFGVTELQPGDTTETMLKRADRGLYQAKDSGRNRVVQLGAGASEESNESSRGIAASWFSWGKREDETLAHRVLRNNVPMNLVAEKVRGFISDHGAEVVSADENLIVLCFDERSMPTQRRTSDRPITLYINVELKSDEKGTQIEVNITGKRGRDRRRDEITGRAEQLLQSLKSYLVAEDV